MVDKNHKKRMDLREAFKNVLADFVCEGSIPPPYPLNGKSFCQKTLSRKGGYTTPPPLTENCRKFPSKNGSKRAKLGVFWPKIAVF